MLSDRDTTAARVCVSPLHSGPPCPSPSGPWLPALPSGFPGAPSPSSSTCTLTMGSFTAVPSSAQPCCGVSVGVGMAVYTEVFVIYGAIIAGCLLSGKIDNIGFTLSTVVVAGTLMVIEVTAGLHLALSGWHVAAWVLLTTGYTLDEVLHEHFVDHEALARSTSLVARLIHPVLKHRHFGSVRDPGGRGGCNLIFWHAGRRGLQRRVLRDAPVGKETARQGLAGSPAPDSPAHVESASPKSLALSRCGRPYQETTPGPPPLVAVCRQALDRVQGAVDGCGSAPDASVDEGAGARASDAVCSAASGTPSSRSTTIGPVNTAMMKVAMATKPRKAS